MAFEAACQAFPAQRHRFSPKKFTQPPLAACLVLKEFLRVDYRGLAEHLATIRQTIKLIDQESLREQLKDKGRSSEAAAEKAESPLVHTPR